jgi:hypothetical protein
MTVPPAPFWSSFPAPIRVSGDLCLLPVFLRPYFFGNASGQVFEALERSRVPSRPPLQPGTGLAATGKKRFNTQ